MYVLKNTDSLTTDYNVQMGKPGPLMLMEDLLLISMGSGSSFKCPQPL